MNVVLPKPGKYVVAVSGGVDSMVLLHLLSQQEGLQLVVAHLDHGIRNNSSEDRKLVEATAKKLNLNFIYDEANLGPGASEAKAREARYRFLRKVLKDNKANAIITAHHQDDLLETAILNMLRGSGRKGLTSLDSNGDIIRPLLGVTKAEIRAYAQAHTLDWNEDETNSDDSYLRNYVRHNILQKFDDKARQQLLDIINSSKVTNEELDTLLVKQLSSQSVDGEIDRAWFMQLPHEVAREVIASWLRAHEVRDFDKKTLERLVVAGKTAAVGKSFPVLSSIHMKVSKESLALKGRER